MNKVEKLIYSCIVLFVGSQLASKFSYNILIENRTPKWLVFIQHPYQYIKYRGKQK